MEMMIYNKTVFKNLIPILNKLRKQKTVVDNFYNYNSDEVDVEFCLGIKTILIRKLENDFYRLYVISSDYEETLQMLKNQNSEHAINIPAKKPIEIWTKLLLESGYSCVGIYERMYYKDVKKRTNRDPVFADLSYLDEVYNNLYLSFNKTVDHLPSKNSLIEMINNKQVILTQNDHSPKGFLIYSIEKEKCYLNAWLDHTGEGFLLLFDVFNIILNNKIKYSYFWVNSINIDVKRIHQLLGANFDGLKDYTFIKIK